MHNNIIQYHTVHTVQIPYYRWLTNCIYCNMHVAKVTVTRYRMHYAWRWRAVLETHLWQYVCGVYWASQYVHSTPWYIYIHYTTHYMAHPTAPCVLVQRSPEPAAGTRSAHCERGQTHGHTAYPVPTSQAPVCVCVCVCVCVWWTVENMQTCEHIVHCTAWLHITMYMIRMNCVTE